LPWGQAELHRAGLGFSRSAFQQGGEFLGGGGLGQGERLLHLLGRTVFDDDRGFGPTNLNQPLARHAKITERLPHL